MIDNQIKELFNNATVIGITSHVRPDGDAVGSVLALGLALINAGKKVEMVLHSGVSKTFRHLTGAELIKRTFSSERDLFIVVDSSDELRTGGVLNGRQADIVIDHHITNKSFGKVNLIVPEAVATCDILARHMPAWGLKIDKDVASALLSGIISDSIGFRTSNTTAASLRIAADLMDKGADITALYSKALISKPFESFNYWGYGLAKLQREDGLVWTTLTLEDRKNAGYSDEDDADLTNILSSIEDIDIAVLFIEQKTNHVKVSWRARPGLNVATIADSLGGGGHPPAAGADLEGNLSEVQEKILKLTREYLDTMKSQTKHSTNSREME
jgi:phosphoesterase RecJ-like protein